MIRKYEEALLDCSPFAGVSFEYGGLWFAELVAPTGEIVLKTDGFRTELAAASVATGFAARKRAEQNRKRAIWFREHQFV